MGDSDRLALVGFVVKRAGMYELAGRGVRMAHRALSHIPQYRQAQATAVSKFKALPPDQQARLAEYGRGALDGVKDWFTLKRTLNLGAAGAAGAYALT